MEGRKGQNGYDSGIEIFRKFRTLKVLQNRIDNVADQMDYSNGILQELYLISSTMESLLADAESGWPIWIEDEEYKTPFEMVQAKRSISKQMYHEVEVLKVMDVILSDMYRACEAYQESLGDEKGGKAYQEAADTVKTLKNDIYITRTGIKSASKYASCEDNLFIE
jgi:hypothetical protein